MGSNDIVAITGIAVTLAVSVANLIYSIRTNRRTVFVNTVTASRLKWIDSLRDEVSEFIALTYQLAQLSNSPEKTAELSLRRDTLLHQIALHLNPQDSDDQKINQLATRAKDLTGSGDKMQELASELANLREAAAKYLKKEWNRVKRESGGSASL